MFPVLFLFLSLNIQPSDTIEGTYTQHHIKYGEFGYNNDTGIEYFESYMEPDTISIHSLVIHPGNNFTETFYVPHPKKDTEPYTERTGTWTFRNDTLVLSYTTEGIYHEKEKQTLVRLIDWTSTYSEAERTKTLVLVYGIKLWETDPYSSLCLLKEE